MNVAASVRQRLLNLARARQDDFQRILTQYALERLLYRLSQSEYAGGFILKGALLFLLWTEEPHRRTRDLDLLGAGDPSPARYAAIFRTLCTLTVEEDGLVFDPASVTAQHIREENIYGGVRVTLTALLENARIRVQVDVGFGDAVAPEPAMVEFPTLLNFAPPRLRAYAPETVIAEKLSALVALDLANSRLKDFFDLWFLARSFAFDGSRLADAIAATFARRVQPLPRDTPTGLTTAFAGNAAKQTQWQAFVRQNVSTSLQVLTLPEVVAAIALFLLPVLEALRESAPFTKHWEPGGPWTEDKVKKRKVENRVNPEDRPS